MHPGRATVLPQFDPEDTAVLGGGRMMETLQDGMEGGWVGWWVSERVTGWVSGWVGGRGDSDRCKKSK